MLTEEIDHVERKVERILEMSFDHTAAMISLLNKEQAELKPESILCKSIVFGRIQLRRNINVLRIALDGLKFNKGNKLEVFQHKCQEFGI